MKTVEMKKATATLARYAREASKEPIIVMDKGKPVAAVVAIEEEDMETISVGTNPQFLSLKPALKYCPKLDPLTQIVTKTIKYE